MEGGQSKFLYDDGICKDLKLYPLQQIVRIDLGKVHVVIRDGAGLHQKDGQARPPGLPENVDVLTLPPYSLELDLIEKLCDIVKDEICSVNWPEVKALEN